MTPEVSKLRKYVIDRLAEEQELNPTPDIVRSRMQDIADGISRVLSPYNNVNGCGMRVICDMTNNTQQDIDNNVLNITLVGNLPSFIDIDTRLSDDKKTV